mmetsp:Transcript_23917/g.53210  ORF Transcript_23917/g.53210 Transcript_23917/m.53210 type:complete len:129 (-) Transcript_23917:1208-1594(-)
MPSNSPEEIIPEDDTYLIDHSLYDTPMETEEDNTNKITPTKTTQHITNPYKKPTKTKQKNPLHSHSPKPMQSTKPDSAIHTTKMANSLSQIYSKRLETQYQQEYSKAFSAQKELNLPLHQINRCLYLP